MLQKIGVIGGGMIGASLAALFAGNGIQVTLVELDGFVDKERRIAKVSTAIWRIMTL